MLSERIQAAEAVPMSRRKADHPTREQIVERYHNQPCPLRKPALEVVS